VTTVPMTIPSDLFDRVRVTPPKPALPTPSPVLSSKTDPDTVLRGMGVGPGVGLAVGQGVGGAVGLGVGTAVDAGNGQGSDTAWAGAKLRQKANTTRVNHLLAFSFRVSVFATHAMALFCFVVL
jgi:hypothetical protein